MILLDAGNVKNVGCLKQTCVLEDAYFIILLKLNIMKRLTLSPLLIVIFPRARILE